MTELRRTLGLWQGVALYVGAVLGTGVLALPAIAAETAGPASLLAWLALILLSVPLAFAYAALSRQRPDAAGFSDAIERAFGSRWGAAAGWLFLAQVPSGSVVVALIAGEYARSTIGAAPEVGLVLGGALVITAYAVNFAGLRVSATAQMLTLATIAVGLILIVGRALPAVEPRAFSPFMPHGTTAVGLAAVQLFWAFVGWEAITPLAQEFRQSRDIWRASAIALVIVGTLYLALAVAVIGTRVYGTSVEATAPLALLASRVFGANASRVVGLAGFLLSFIPLNAYIAGTSRLTYALGKRAQVPTWVGVLSPSGTPVRALVALCAGSAVAWTVAYAAHLRVADLLPLSTSAFIATYVLSMAAATRLLRPPLSHAATVALLACMAILLFVGPYVAWIAAIAAAALVYQRLRGPSRQSDSRGELGRSPAP